MVGWLHGERCEGAKLLRSRWPESGAWGTVPESKGPYRVPKVIPP